jgi:hypothetical protein
MEPISEDGPDLKAKNEEEQNDGFLELPVVANRDSVIHSRNTIRQLSIMDSGRRKSIVGPGLFPSAAKRRRSTSGGAKNQFDEEALKMFFASHGLTRKDIDEGFEFLSQDKKKLTHGDIKLFVSTYFDWFPEEAMSLLNSWKEEITKEQLYAVLLNKTLMTSPYESSFKVCLFVGSTLYSFSCYYLLIWCDS